jgi:hypothetical protein
MQWRLSTAPSTQIAVSAPRARQSVLVAPTHLAASVRAEVCIEFLHHLVQPMFFCWKNKNGGALTARLLFLEANSVFASTSPREFRVFDSISENTL